MRVDTGSALCYNRGMIDNTDDNVLAESSGTLTLSEAEFVKLRRLLIEYRPPEDDEVMVLQSCKRLNDLVSAAVNLLCFRIEIIGESLMKAMGRKGKWESQPDIVMLLQEHVE